MFTAVVFVLTSGCAWRMLPPSFRVTVPTAHRRFTAWTEAGLWRRLHQTVLDELGSRGLIDWSRAVIDAASVRAKKDIPGARRSSGSGVLVSQGPRHSLVVDGSGLEAAVEDADEAVGELAQRGLVFETAGSMFVVVGAGAG
ncbi:putative transposase of IS4/5 family (DUF4096) [Nocardia amikacinitolerans]|nr:putative transposase of IS4/5 family (DUF4096) [Nocardia amikacinitolerans]